jgi:hypothetical protein
MPETPPKSTREKILDAVVARLAVIATDHEDITFASAAGQSVHLGEAPPFGPDDPLEAIVVAVGDDDPRFQGEAFLIVLPLSIQAIVAVPAGQLEIGAAYRAAEAILADVKRAIELEDRTLGGLVKWHGLERGSTRTLRREPGSEFVGIEIGYSAPYAESWGAP